MKTVKNHQVYEESVEESVDEFFLDKIRKKKKKSLLLDEVFRRNDLSPQTKNMRDISPLLVKDAGFSMEFWETGWVFRVIEDIDWRIMTKNAFPATIRKGHTRHPGYVTREIGNYALELCPLSSKRWTNEQFIPEGKVLTPTNYVTDRNSYVIARASVRLPRSNRIFDKNLKFLGIYPPEQLES